MHATHFARSHEAPVSLLSWSLFLPLVLGPPLQSLPSSTLLCSGLCRCLIPNSSSSSPASTGTTPVSRSPIRCLPNCSVSSVLSPASADGAPARTSMWKQTAALPHRRCTLSPATTTRLLG